MLYREIVWRFILLVYGCYGLTSSVTIRRLTDENVAANDVIEYFHNLDMMTFPSLTELEKNINLHPKIKILELKL